MLKKYLLIATLLSSGYVSKSQIVYEPIRLPPSSGYPAQEQPQSQQNTETINGYVINPTTKSIVKYKIKTVVIGKQVKIVAYRPISSEYWSSLSLPITATRISMYDALSEQFEYKVYLTPLLAYIYF